MCGFQGSAFSDFYVHSPDVAKGFGLTTVAKSGNEVVRWARVNNYLHEFGFSPKCGRKGLDLPKTKAASNMSNGEPSITICGDLGFRRMLRKGLDLHKKRMVLNTSDGIESINISMNLDFPHLWGKMISSAVVS